MVASASGTRIDCDMCGEHVSSPDLTAARLRAATGYVRPAEHSVDFCPRCAQNLLGAAVPDGRAPTAG